MRKSTGNTCAWEQRKLGDFTGKVTEKNTGMSVTETFTNSAEFGVISQLDFFDHAVSKDESISGYTIVCPEDFVYNPRISVTAPVGPINRNRLNRAGVMSPLYTVFRTDGSIDRVYLEHFFKTSGWHSYMQLNGNSGARSDRFSIGDDTFFAMPIPAPSLEEQRQLAGFLESLDTLITLHQREESCAASFSASCFGTLKAFFWEQRKLGEVAASFEYGLNAAAKEFDGVNKYLRITDIDDESHEFRDDDLTSPDTDLSAASNYQLHNGEILFARTGASVGKSFIYRESDGLVYFAGFLIRARIKPEYDAEFVFQNTLGLPYEKYIQVTSQRSGQPGVNAQEYAEYSFMVPSYAEQKRIGGFLRQIDALITLHQCKPKSRKGGSHVLYSYQV